jgi:hypothetical protein
MPIPLKLSLASPTTSNPKQEVNLVTMS